MYKVEVLTPGIFKNVTLGPRYILGKKETISFCKQVLELECKIKVYKFVRCAGTVFCWSENEGYGDILLKIIMREV